MKLHLIFIGNKFRDNEVMREYILRTIAKTAGFADEVSYYKESDNRLFLRLENELEKKQQLLIVTARQNFSTVGKLLCTITQDNQVLKEGMLVPQGATLFDERSYLLEYKENAINVLHIDEGEVMPRVLLSTQETKEGRFHIFEEQKEDITAILTPLAQTYDVVFTATLYVDGWVCVRVYSKRYGDIANFIHAAKKLLPAKLIAAGDIMEYIIEKLSQEGKKLTFAESCTGGLLSYYLTKHNGASKILDGSLVTYSNALKENWLAVEEQTLQSVGAVSREVVEQMSEGALNVSEADYALAVSGIAGDGGGTQEKPVGTVYISARSKEKYRARGYLFEGDRNYVQHQSALMAIKMLLLVDKELFF